MTRLYLIPALLVSLLVFAGEATASYIVEVQPVVTADDDGENISNFLGSSDSESFIKSAVDDIWAQADISVNWYAETVWDSSFGQYGDETDANDEDRDSGDLSWLVNNGDAAGKGHTDSHVIDMYFVDRVPGFSDDDLGSGTAAGLAFLDAAGVSMFVGSNLIDATDSAMEVAAHVLAHEIGHNLGLPHYDVEGNLMHTDGNDGGPSLTEDQISTAQSSDLLLTAIPEPASGVLLLAAGGMLLTRRRRT